MLDIHPSPSCLLRCVTLPLLLCKKNLPGLRVKQKFLKLSLYLIKDQVMKTCVGMEAYIQIFLFSVLEVSGSAELPRDSLNAGEKREKVSYLYCKCKFESTVAQPEAYSLYRPQTIPTQLSLFHSRRSRCKQTCSIYKKIFVVLIFRSSSNTFIPSGRQVFA